MEERKLWEERAQRTGHTGYSDPFLYAYDQPLRLRAFEDLLRRPPYRGRVSRALDLGCGIGDFCRILNDRGARVVGIDLSLTALRRARESFVPGAGIGFVQGNAEVIPVASRAFDFVVAVTVLQHLVPVTRLQAALTEIRRVLVPGGHLVALEISPDRDGDEEGVLVEPGLVERGLSAWLRLFASVGFATCQVQPYAPWGVELVQGVRRMVGRILLTGGLSRPAATRGDTGIINPQLAPSPLLRAARGIYRVIEGGILAVTYPLDHWMHRSLPGHDSYYHFFHMVSS